MSLGIGQHNSMEIFAVKWNIISEMNDFFAELDGSSGLRILLLTD